MCKGTANGGDLSKKISLMLFLISATLLPMCVIVVNTTAAPAPAAPFPFTNGGNHLRVVVVVVDVVIVVTGLKPIIT